MKPRIPMIKGSGVLNIPQISVFAMLCGFGLLSVYCFVKFK